MSQKIKESPEVKCAVEAWNDSSDFPVINMPRMDKKTADKVYNAFCNSESFVYVRMSSYLEPLYPTTDENLIGMYLPEKSWHINEHQ